MLVGGGVWYWFYKTTVQDDATTNTTKTSLSASPSASVSASASPPSSISWKTYTNNAYKYSFEYPADTKPISGETSPITEIENKTIVQFSYGDRSSFDIRSSATEESTIENYLKNVDLSKYTKTKVASETAYQISGKFGSYREFTHFLHNGSVYTISGSFGGGEDYECGGAISDTPCGTPSPKETATQVVYDKILSSFKFL